MSPMVLPIRARAIGEEIGDAARAHVGFGLADDLVGLLFLGVLVDELHRGAELDPCRRRASRRRSPRRGEIRLSSSRTRPSLRALGLLGGMVFGVLRQVAKRAGFGDRLDDPRALNLLAVLAAPPRAPHNPRSSSGPCPSSRLVQKEVRGRCPSALASSTKTYQKLRSSDREAGCLRRNIPAAPGLRDRRRDRP